MKKQIITVTVTIFCIITLLPYMVAADRLTVVASVFPLFDFAREVAGPAADVKLLLPPGVDPHSWEPAPSDIVELSRSDIFLYTSMEMEPWAATFAKAIKKRDIISVRIMDGLGIPPHDEHEEENNHELQEEHGQSEDLHKEGHDHGRDPHFWLNLSLSAEAVSMIGKAMADIDPDNRNLYLSNARTYAERLTDLDKAYMAGLENCNSRQLVTGGHAAFGHLARRYGLDQVAVYGMSPDAEPSPRHLADIVSLVREKKIQTVFAEKLMNPRMAEVLAKETGTRILVLTPAGNLTADQWQHGTTFLKIMKSNLDTLREGLVCE